MSRRVQPCWQRRVTPTRPSGASAGRLACGRPASPCRARVQRGPVGRRRSCRTGGGSAGSWRSAPNPPACGRRACAAGSATRRTRPGTPQTGAHKRDREVGLIRLDERIGHRRGGATFSLRRRKPRLERADHTPSSARASPNAARPARHFIDSQAVTTAGLDVGLLQPPAQPGLGDPELLGRPG